MSEPQAQYLPKRKPPMSTETRRAYLAQLRSTYQRMAEIYHLLGEEEEAARCHEEARTLTAVLVRTAVVDSRVLRMK